MPEIFKTYSAFDPSLQLRPHGYVPRPLGEMDCEIKISHCGICGSDLHTMSSGWRPVKYPLCCGHEIVGHVTAKGGKVTQHQIGDRVGVGAQSRACWRSDCYEVRLGCWHVGLTCRVERK